MNQVTRLPVAPVSLVKLDLEIKHHFSAARDSAAAARKGYITTN